MIYLFPLLMPLLGGYLLWQLQKRRGPRGQFLDLGQAFILIVVVYATVPGIGFLLAHLGYGEIVDSRLWSGYDVELVEYVQWMYAGFMAAFGVSYLAVRRYGQAPTHLGDEARGPHRRLIYLALALVLGQPLLMRLLGGDPGEDYISSYAALRDAPLVVQQLFGVAQQITFSALVAAVVYAVAASPAKHLRVALALAVFLVYASLAGGSRTAAFLAFFAYLVAASVYVKGFTVSRVLAAAGPALVLFMIAGLLRDNDPDADMLRLVQSGEFTALFVNTVDLKDRFDSGFADEVRFLFYFVDLLRLIPSQLLGGEKLDPARWYVETFYFDYYDAGGGYAFGLLSEAAAGTGLPDALVRGALLGSIFAWLANRLIEGRVSVRRVFVYTWLVVLAYQSFRDTTFSLIVRAVYQLLPLLALLALDSWVRAGSGAAWPARRVRPRPMSTQRG